MIEATPGTYEEAINGVDAGNWKAAIDEELDALERNNTWSLVPLPQDKQSIDSKWVFKVKTTTNGKRYKARLCARGFAQIKGTDYNETYSPTTRYDTIRILLAYAVQQNYKIVQFDVKTAFLYGELEEDIYMAPPLGVTTEQGLVCKLNKSLYGLKQAPRCWNKKFGSFLKSFGFKQCESDKCVYVGNFNNETVILVIYVDDGLILTKKENLLHKITDKMKQTFEITLHRSYVETVQS
uniref:Reverse transcriptase Ty1/copia-type domain-containing protein n=1 Tax=Photinus pyralis TaxID=7054 RepID=A0A1Y1N3J9_PHOPY